MKKIERIEPKLPQIKRKKRVAAYARVSAESDRLNHSLSAQVSYYSHLIQKNPEWEYAGVYADSFISGTSIDKRDEFQRLLADCETGKVEIILTKSISRFARNTVDLLSTVRHLKAIGVEVWFEKEHINSLTSSGEVMLSILASFAQEESVNNSENVKWAKRKRFEQGLPHAHFNLYGYKWEGDRMLVVPEEAAVVKRIYQAFLEGKSRRKIAQELSDEGITSREGCRWSIPSINYILKNVTYTGNLLLQKYYVENPLTHKVRINNGEFNRYLVKNSHVALVDKETFDHVQRKLAGLEKTYSTHRSCFTRKIKCPFCGHSYVYCKYQTTVNEYWAHHEKKNCPVSWIINQVAVKGVCAEVLATEQFDEEIFLQRVDFINVPQREILEIHLKNGQVISKVCRNPKRERGC